jgi:glycosyltransferase involved in cell wall biosynthesis
MLSIIIPAHDEEPLIGRTLRALRRARDVVDCETGVPSEVIVVDDTSTDGTADVALAHGARVVRVEHRRISSTRNAGARVARGSELLFVDADTLVPPVTLVAAVGALRDGAVGGGARIVFDRPIPAWAALLESPAAVMYRVLGLASGCFTFCRRDAFEAIGGYDESVVAAEEGLLSRALRRHGRLVVLRQPVYTSGRKLRTYSGREILRLVTGVTLHGRSGIEHARHWEILYGKRRADPREAVASCERSA